MKQKKEKKKTGSEDQVRGKTSETEKRKEEDRVRGPGLRENE